MKRVKVLLITLVVMVCVHLFAEVSKEEARNIVYQIVGDEIEYVNIFQEEDILSDSNYEINEQKSINSPYSDYWLFFVDDIPAALWYHSCRYVLINSSDGEYLIIIDDTPPQNYKSRLEEVSIFFVVEPFEYSYHNPELRDPVEPDPHKFAVLMVGRNEDIEEFYFWNTLSALYTTLKNNYGFTDENMIVLCQENILYDPAAPYYTSAGYSYILDFDLDNDDVNDIDDGCYLQSIESAFENMAENLGSDDQLFVATIGHGAHNPSSGLSIYCVGGWGTMWDNELADMLAPINCGEMVITMGQCYSGGFIDELTDYTSVQCENRIIHTATDADNYAYTGGGIAYGFTEFLYYWITGIRGCHPASYSEPWEEGHLIGEYPTQLFDLDFDPDEPEYGGNNDEIYQLGESFKYSFDLDRHNLDGINYIGYQPEYPCDVSDIGFIDDVYSIFGFGGNISHSQTVSGNFTFVTPVIIEPGVVLTFDTSWIQIEEDASFTIDCSELFITNYSYMNIENGSLNLNNSEIMIDNYSSISNSDNISLAGKSLMDFNNSNFSLHPSSSLYGTEPTIWVDPSTGENYNNFVEAYNNIPEIGAEHEIPGDRIIIHNNSIFYASGTEDEPITIGSNGDSFWEGIEIKDCLYDDLASRIKYCIFSNVRKISISNSYLSAFLNCSITNCGQLLLSEVIYEDPIEVLFRYNTYSNNSAPLVVYLSEIDFMDNIVENNSGGGIVMHYIDEQVNHFFNNVIRFNQGCGIKLYDCPAKFWNNTISENTSNAGHGLLSMGNVGGTYFWGDNTLENNEGAEILAFHNCFPFFLGNESIIDQYSSGGCDHYLLMCAGHDYNDPNYSQHDVSALEDIDISDPSRFFPDIDAFYFGIVRPPEKVIYEEAIIKIMDEENYEAAKFDMKEIIEIYPETETALNALQWLTYLENFSGQDFEALRNYIENIDSSINTHFENPKSKAVTSTYFMEKDYETVISRLEEVIYNPPSEQDSIFALIDEGYCYLKLLESGNRALPQKCSIKPKSLDEYSIINKGLVSQLLGENNSYNNDLSVPSNAVLQNNFPNPFNPETTISFSIPEDSKVDLFVYNIKGQKVKSLLNSNLEKGNHSVVWNGVDDSGKSVSSGVYFYKLSVDGKSKSVKKCLMLK